MSIYWVAKLREYVDNLAHSGDPKISQKARRQLQQLVDELEAEITQEKDDEDRV